MKGAIKVRRKISKLRAHLVWLAGVRAKNDYERTLFSVILPDKTSESDRSLAERIAGLKPGSTWTEEGGFDNGETE